MSQAVLHEARRETHTNTCLAWREEKKGAVKRNNEIKEEGKKEKKTKQRGE